MSSKLDISNNTITISESSYQKAKNKFNITKYYLDKEGFKYTKKFPKPTPYIDKQYKGYFTAISVKEPEHTVYKNSNGEVIPSVTTILKKAYPLGDYITEWANSLGFQRINYKKFMTNIVEVGTAVHLLIETVTKNNIDIVTNELLMSLFKNNPYFLQNEDTIFRCFCQFLIWYNYSIKNANFELIANELELTSQKYNYGGTIDMICKLNGETTIIDLKTSSALDAKMLLQLSAYAMMYEENTGEKVHNVGIVRMDKNDESCFEFFFISVDELSIFKETFLEMIQYIKKLENIEEKFYELLDNNVKYKKDFLSVIENKEGSLK